MSEVTEQVAIGDTAGSETSDHKAESTQTKKLLELPLEVRALRKLQLETKDIQSEFFKQIYELEIELQKKHDLVYKKRSDIVNGICVPTNEDAPESAIEKNEATPAQGIPNFWSNVLSSTLFEIHSSDRPILEHLTDVRARNKPFSELGFILEFDFSPNEYFENATLTKEYFYTCSLGDAMVHQGPQIYKSVGCEINWKNGKACSKESFFNFFRSKTENEEIFGSDETYGMSNDFEMGYFIKERIIPRAVLFYNEHHCIDDPFLSANSCSSLEPQSTSASSMLLSQSKCGDDKSTTASTISNKTD